MSLLGFVAGFLARAEPDGIAARQREIAGTLAERPCVHGAPGAWLVPLRCVRCRAVIEASRVAADKRAREASRSAEMRMRAALEDQFVREVREEVERLRATRA
jgi:hypothetical protein